MFFPNSESGAGGGVFFGFWGVLIGRRRKDSKP